MPTSCSAGETTSLVAEITPRWRFTRVTNVASKSWSLLGITRPGILLGLADPSCP